MSDWNGRGPVFNRTRGNYLFLCSCILPTRYQTPWALTSMDTVTRGGSRIKDFSALILSNFSENVMNRGARWMFYSDGRILINLGFFVTPTIRQKSLCLFDTVTH